jgi:hypothetical protein
MQISGNRRLVYRVNDGERSSASIAFAPLIAKENPVRLIVRVAGMATLLCLMVPSGFAQTHPASKMHTAGKSSEGVIVIVFKDGRRQSFNLADIARLEFPSGAVASGETASASSPLPSRSRFLGKWKVGEGNGMNFFITLEENGEAHRSLHNEHGKWVYVNGEAQVTWDDGAQDAIRKVGSYYHKYAYGAGKAFTDTPDNVTDAQNTTPHPI